MTDLERQLTAALEGLSAQYEMERRRQSEQVEALQQQVEALQRQVERLSGQVTHLTGDYGTHGVKLPRRLGGWRSPGSTCLSSFLAPELRPSPSHSVHWIPAHSCVSEVIQRPLVWTTKRCMTTVYSRHG